MANPNPARITDALWQFAQDFCAAEPDAVCSGIWADKPGYHNARNNLPASDYSVADSPLDLQGPADKAAAVDLTFRTAQAGDFLTIAKYCDRIDAAMRNRDLRLYHDGKPVVREWFGNDDSDRMVEGYSMFRMRFMSSTPSHMWHLHLSFHRWCVDNWPAVSGVLAVLLNTNKQADPQQRAEADVSFIGLEQGDKGAIVKELQMFLRGAGFDPGTIDGNYGAKTAGAVLACRVSQGSGAKSGDAIDSYASDQIRAAFADRRARGLVEASARQLRDAIAAATAAQLPARVVIDLPDSITVPVEPVEEVN